MQGKLLACRRALSIHARITEHMESKAGSTALQSGLGLGLGHGLELGSMNGQKHLGRREVFKLMEVLYRDHPGAVWRDASRKAMELCDEQKPVTNLIYGEVSYIAFVRLLDRYAPSNPVESGAVLESNHISDHTNFTFYDLGCGAGRPVFMACMLWTNCTKACGIEILPSVHRMNQDLLQLYKKEELSFLCDDFLRVDWSDADIVFTNATCFDDSLFAKLEEKASRIMKEHAIFISVTRSFNNSSWELLEEQERRMSWASSMVYVYRKKAEHPQCALSNTPPEVQKER
ncbi:hypothetical protein O6H91_14G057300 [Diphasiastrum complanatum]|uniref:Uncharacterized protein n=1 Tax=Diphasiastrum complanatum TaxID=34168 RepID=A0ACC2BPN8_DIPCM|nr:hypothetical protein O6H91_14G057300 [Diphasiastrum complanatum]